jgi:hypothetical protein
MLNGDKHITKNQRDVVILEAQVHRSHPLMGACVSFFWDRLPPEVSYTMLI